MVFVSQLLCIATVLRKGPDCLIVHATQLSKLIMRPSGVGDGCALFMILESATTLIGLSQPLFSSVSRIVTAPIAVPFSLSARQPFANRLDTDSYGANHLLDHRRLKEQ